MKDSWGANDSFIILSIGKLIDLFENLEFLEELDLFQIKSFFLRSNHWSEKVESRSLDF